MIPGNQKHMTLSDRIEIEKGLKEQQALKDIAKVLCKDPTTISKEIKLHRQFRATSWKEKNSCKHRRSCKKRNLCTNGSKCDRICSLCRMNKCNSLCHDYEYEVCNKLKRAPYVCNGCSKSSCRLDKYYYRADAANKEYEALRRESRIGINATPDEVSQLGEIVSAGVKKGQSIAHIVLTNKTSIKRTERTIYNYIDGGYFPVKNLDLPRKLHYKPRKTNKAKEERKIATLDGRRYTDFTKFMSEHDYHVTEMDTVKGSEGTKKVLLTMQIVCVDTLLSFLLDGCTQDEVIRALDDLERTISTEVFRKTFPVILTDRGSEFICAERIEKSIDGGMRCRVFYCDPNAPFQKPHLEKNHTHIRSVFPKKSAFATGEYNSFDSMTQEKITLMVNHINSLHRDSLCGLSPMFIALAMLEPKLIEALGLELIPADEVTLTPALLN
jgi:IS30 family transposase